MPDVRRTRSLALAVFSLSLGGGYGGGDVTAVDQFTG